VLTRCPRCETTFRVTPDQLKARHGRVRCGHCQNVFNALDTLIEASPHPAVTPAPKAPMLEEQPAAEPAVPSRIIVEPPAVETEASQTDEDQPGPESQDDDVGEPIAESEDEATPVALEAEAQSSAPPLQPLLHDEPKRRAWPWAIGCLAATVTLAAQAGIHYRTEVAVLYPGATPLLNAVCVPFGCEVSLPRKAELVGIETSNLSPDSTGKLTLSATLTNRAPFTQQFPDLELTLTDVGDKALVRRVLAPADYLTPQALAAGFAAGSEAAVNLTVDAPGVPAAGYQLYLFYP
jgi:predicted Zn finger-like uncharacterized protein